MFDRGQRQRVLEAEKQCNITNDQIMALKKQVAVFERQRGRGRDTETIRWTESEGECPNSRAKAAGYTQAGFMPDLRLIGPAFRSYL